MSLFNRNQAPKAASTDQLMDMCAKHNLETIVPSLRSMGVDIAQAKAIVEDANNLRDRCAAGFMHNPSFGRKIADDFIAASYGKGFMADAVANLILEVQAEASGQEIDHHHPAGASESAFNPSNFYNSESKS